MTFRNERKKMILQGEVMNRIIYSNVNQAMHTASISNQGTIQSLVKVGLHRSLVAAVVVMVLDLLDGFMLEQTGRYSLNWGRVSAQMVTTERTMNNMEMILTNLAFHEDSGFSNNCQIYINEEQLKQFLAEFFEFFFLFIIEGMN